MAVRVYRSTDTNAPKLGGWAGALTDLLLACLVNGYGSVFAAATITSNGTNVSNNDSVTVDGVTYTFKTALTPAANEVLIGASAAASLANLAAAINLQGASGTTYGAGTLTPPSAYSSNVTATVLSLSARRGGTTGNSIAISKSAATLTLSGATLSGGSGSDTAVGAGWTNPFNGTGGQRVFQAASGVQHYYHFDDATPNLTALGKEAQFRGSEAATAFQNWTNPFPTIAQFALGSGLMVRKSVTADNTNRAWICICDGRTVYLHVLTGDTVGEYRSIGFGEFFATGSTTDNYRSFVIGRSVANSGANSTANDNFGFTAAISANLIGHYVPRIYNAGGTATQFTKTLSPAGQTSTAAPLNGALITGAEVATGAIILVPLTVADPSVNSVRGRMRGMFGSVQTSGTFGDGDTVVGSGAYTGRTFLAINRTVFNNQNCTSLFDVTGDWETN